MESDATSLSLEKSVSFEVIPSVTQGDDQVTEEDADNVEDQRQTMGDVQEFIAVGRTQKIHVSPVGSLLTCSWPMFSQPLRRQSHLLIEKLKSV